jgi:acyl-CoA synthetase (AMP-forming)/AMP-acid ligase II
MIAAELVRRGARHHRDRVAVRYGDDRLTFGEVISMAHRFGRALLSAGLRPGDPVGLLADNNLLSLPVDFALLLFGLIRVPLNSRLSEDEHAKMLTGARCHVMLFQDVHSSRATALAGRLPGLTVIPITEDGSQLRDLSSLAADESDAAPTVRIGADDVMLRLFTSGTTGTLKAAEHTQRSYAAVCANVLANLVSPGPDDVMIHAASLIHASGMFVLPFWMRGATAAILPGFDAQSYLDAVEEYGATVANLVPTMLQLLLSLPGIANRPLPTLQTIVYGASPMPRPVITRSLSLWGPRFVQYYGQSEAPLAITSLTKQDHVGAKADRVLGSCGQGSVETELRLVGEDGQDVGRGETGQLLLRAPFAMLGYFDAPELNARTVGAGGWIATRDLAVQDEDGYYHLVDRTSDMIVSGGYNVYPREVEDALLSHADVVEAAVVGAPDEVWVEAVTAFVVLRPGATVDVEHLREHVRGGIAAYKVPKSVHVVDAIPKSAVGKILRRALRDPLWPGTDRPGGRV